jgi:hypothetical protein
MRVAYSVLKEIHRKTFMPNASDYGLSELEFQNFIFLLEKKGYLERVLKVNDDYSIKAARLTGKGISLLQQNGQYEESYPERACLKKWVQVEKDLYSNSAD